MVNVCVPFLWKKQGVGSLCYKIVYFHPSKSKFLIPKGILIPNFQFEPLQIFIKSCKYSQFNTKFKNYLILLSVPLKLENISPVWTARTWYSWWSPNFAFLPRNPISCSDYNWKLYIFLTYVNILHMHAYYTPYYYVCQIDVKILNIYLPYGSLLPGTKPTSSWN